MNGMVVGYKNVLVLFQWGMNKVLGRLIDRRVSVCPDGIIMHIRTKGEYDSLMKKIFIGLGEKQYEG
jgi:hypothetical protein